METDQTPRSAASGLGLHYLATSNKKDAMPIWVNSSSPSIVCSNKRQKL